MALFDESNNFGNFLQTLSAMNDPSFMRPSAPSQGMPRQAMGQPAPQQGGYDQNVLQQAYRNAGVGRERKSLVDWIGGIGDALAEMGGEKGAYQGRRDAELERARAYEEDMMAREKFGFEKRKFAADERMANAKVLMEVGAGLQSLLKRVGPDGVRAAMPRLVQAGLFTPQQAEMIIQDPEGSAALFEEMAKGGGTEFGTSIYYATGPDGQLHAFQASKAGGLQQADLPPGFVLQPGVQVVDDGNQNRIIQKPSGATVSTTPKSGNPATGDVAIPDPSAPGGIRYGQAPGSQAALEADAKRREQQEKDEKLLAQNAKARQQATLVRSTVASALEAAKKNWSATGLPGQISQFVGGTPARDLQGLVDTIKSNISIDNLMEMRANSPTGGALGNVSNADIALLASTIASLDITQGVEQFKKNLGIIDRIYKKIEEGSAPGQRNPPAQSGGAGDWQIEEIR